MGESEGRASAGRGAALHIREGGCAWLELRPTRGTPIPLRLDTLHEIDDAVDAVLANVANGFVDFLVIATAPPHPGMTGYDPEELRLLRETEIVGWSQEAQRILRRLEQLPVPSIAAIRSDWLGGAAELALACSYRVMADSAASGLGFPQTRLGFLPVWGGTVRLPRLVGLRTALPLILTGRPVSATEALDIQLVDHLVSPEDFAAQVEAYARLRIERGRPRVRRERSVRRRLLDDTAPGRRLLAARAGRRYLRDGAGSELAARIALDLVAETVALPLELAFARESETAGQLIVTSVTQGRIHSQRYTDRAARRLPTMAGDFDGAAVLGAGQTGSDIAHLLATAGTPVRIKDSSREAVSLGITRALERFAWERTQGRITEKQSRQRAGRISGGSGFGGFGTLDIVVVTPDGTGRGPEELLVEAEPHVRDACVLAFHDWSASPTRVQRGLRIPERLLGIAPSFPLDRFPLLEIVPGTLTSPDVVALARRLARRLSLTSVVVSDDTPTPATRLLGIYFSEAARLLDEGATVTQVDSILEAFGFEAGPFRRIDAIGSRRAFRMLERLAEPMGDRVLPTELFSRLAHAGETFYRYRGNRPAGPNPMLPANPADGGRAESLILDRVTLLLLNEAARILEEGGATDAGDLEVISIFGLGFPRERGGLLFFAEERGVQGIVTDLQREARISGPRYEPAGVLRDLAATGRGFFAADPRPSLDTGPGR